MNCVIQILYNIMNTNCIIYFLCDSNSFRYIKFKWSSEYIRFTQNIFSISKVSSQRLLIGRSPTWVSILEVYFFSMTLQFQIFAIMKYKRGSKTRYYCNEWISLLLHFSLLFFMSLQDRRHFFKWFFIWLG